VFLDDLDRCQPPVIAQALATVGEVFSRRSGDRIAFVLGVDVEIVVGAIDDVFKAVRAMMDRTNPRRSAELSENFLEKVFQLRVNIDATQRHVAERLLGTATLSPQRPSAAPVADIRAAVQQLAVSRPGSVTEVRHLAGITSDVMDAAELSELHRAVRDRRAELLTLGNPDVGDAERVVLSALALTPRAVKRFDNAYRLQLQVANSTPGSELGFGRDDLVATAKWVAVRMFFPSLTRAIDRRPGLWTDLEAAAVRRDEPQAVPTLLGDIATGLDGSAVVDFTRLLAVGYPRSSLRRLPFDTFVTVM
jgi:hypothetical protein